MRLGCEIHPIEIGERQPLYQWSALCLGYPDPTKRSDNERGSSYGKCRAESVLLSHPPNRKWSDSACNTAKVVSKALRCSADSSFVDLCCNRGKSGEIAGSEECHQGAKCHEQP